MYDIAIIGAGPAGLSAAINGFARNKKVCVLGRNITTTALYKGDKINNYLGFYDISGKDMAEKFIDHIKNMNIEIKEGRAQQIMPYGNNFSINFDNDIIEAKSIILATGSEKVKNIKGEEEYLGKGVSYCATCDGMFFRGKDVVVVSNIEEGIEDANFLSEVCNNIYYVTSSKETDKLNKDITVVNSKIKEVIGDQVVKGVVLEDKEVNADGVFFIKPSLPPSTLIAGLETNKDGIVVDNKMKSNLPGVFAAGDCTGKPWQISRAVGQGQIAAFSAVEYINSIKE